MFHHKSLLIIACAIATTVYSMDNDQKTLALKAQFATMSWLTHADPKEVHIHGLPTELATTENRAVLQQVVLAALTTVSLRFPVAKSIWPTPTIDMQKLYAISKVIEHIRKEEAKLKEKQRLEAIERGHNANITMLLEFNGIQSGFEYCKRNNLPTWQYLPAICLAIGE